MKNINYKSDFDFILRLKDCRGEDIGWPKFDWRARFYTAIKVNAFEASCIGGICTNCYEDEGQIHIVADNHKLSAGVLKVEFTSLLPDGTYPDGKRTVVVPFDTDVRLTAESGDCCDFIGDLVLVIPNVGKPGTSPSNPSDKECIEGEALTFDEIDELIESLSPNDITPIEEGETPQHL